jgi:hypothetical protein
MARYIEDLNECTDPVSGDFMWVVDASAGGTDKDRKVDVGKFARLAVAQSFTATQTFSNVSVGTSGGATAITKPNDGHTLVNLDSVTLTAGQKFTFPSTHGLLVVTSSSAGRAAVYALTYATVTAIAQDTSGFSTTMSTASRINVYYNGSFFEIENGFATSRTVSWVVIGY